MLVYNTTSEAYLGTLKDIITNHDYVSSPRGLKILEKMNYSFKVLNPSDSPIVTMSENRNKKIASYTEKEKQLYKSCSNRVEDFAKASKFWEQIANPDGTINSAYGYLIWKNKSHGGTFDSEKITPWEWAKTSLIRDKDTRQAILRFSLPEHQWSGNKDQVCTMHGIFHIRDNKLHLTINMRSNDVVLGLAYDMPWFCSLIDKMLQELKPVYPELSKGTYTHIVHSMHVYEKDINLVNEMLGVTNENTGSR